MKRVVVTGAGCVSPLGNSWGEVFPRLKSYRNAIKRTDEWDVYDGLFTRLAGPAHWEMPAHWSRKMTRSMGRIAMMAVNATEDALADAGLAGDPLLNSGVVGISYGSSAGSTQAMAEFGNMLINERTDGLNATSYIRMMSHTAAVNIGVHFGINGRVYTTSSACTSSSQGIGYGYEAIKYGMQTVMICGGAEELCPTEAAVFDTLYATSTRNDEPEKTPRPFDRDRDGLVIGEGACTLVLEDRDHALARGATIYGEIIGYATNSDGLHVTQPDESSICRVIQGALGDAGIDAGAVGYVSAHGTATARGDVIESRATSNVLGEKTPFSALKSYTGHTLGACGSLEAWVTLNMMREGWFHPTLNLENLDEECGALDYITGEGRHLDTEIAMTNNFAFGGLNTSLLLKKAI